MENPFFIKGYLTAEYFCNRAKETDRLISAVKNNRNITLFSIRKMGKTGLIKHSFGKLSADGSIITIYFDLMPTTNLNEFINVFSSAIYQALESTSKKLFRKFFDLIKALRPTLSFDAFTGVPVISFQAVSAENGQNLLSQVFSFLNLASAEQKIVVAMDEFQQIQNYPEKNIEAILRSKIQMLNNVTFIFSGSQKHLLLPMFNDYKRPFYQSTEFLHLDRIEKSSYAEFIKNLFAKNGRSIEDAVIEKLLDFSMYHTYYVQYVCNRLFSLENNIITEELLKMITNDILFELEASFYNYRNLLTTNQWLLLIALAHESGFQKITSSEFIKRYHLTNHSTVKRSIGALIDKDLVYEENRNYMVYDVFFSRWLQGKYQL